MATALAGVWLAHERPSRRFWQCALLGSAVVVGFALWQGAGKPQLADVLLVAAVAAAAIGYAEGARLARTLGAWQVICWVLVLSAPFLLLPTWLAIDANQLRLDEHVDPATYIAAGLVVVAIALGRKS